MNIFYESSTVNVSFNAYIAHVEKVNKQHYTDIEIIIFCYSPHKVYPRYANNCM